MATIPFRFGISEFTTQPWSFDEDVERYAKLGVDTIEVVEAKLDDARFAEQMQSITAAGLGISGVQPAVRTFFASRMMPQPTDLEARIAALRCADRSSGWPASRRACRSSPTPARIPKATPPKRCGSSATH